MRPVISRRWRKLGILGLILVLGVGLPRMFNLFSRRPANLGIHDGCLSPCPAAPNCVCSHAKDGEHAIAPLHFSGDAAAAVARLKQVLAGMPRNRIITETETYLHVEFTTLLLRFVDDVEFLVDEPAHLIQFRSASRVGYSDLGVNRARMETIRQAFERTN